MILDNIRLLSKLYYKPLDAMSGFIDQGSWLYSAVATLIVSALLYVPVAAPLYRNYEAALMSHKELLKRGQAPAEVQEELAGEGEDFQIEVRKPLPVIGELGWRFFTFEATSLFTSFLAIAVIYVPITILLMIFFEPLGSFGVVFRRDYGPLLTCTLMGWTAAHLPAALAGLLLQQLGGALELLFIVWLAAKLYFGFLMVFALRAVFSARYLTALITVALAALSVMLEGCLFWLASPFLLIFIYSAIRGDIGDIDAAFRRRQSFRRSLEAATVNPQDAEAHYQLGLIYQQRRQYSEAVARFQRAVEIDRREVDAHFQLGRIAREQGRLQDAIQHFDTVVALDDKHSHSEVWREIGATYEAASMYEDAHAALSRYIERRPYDPEGLYHFGKVLGRLGNKEQAGEILNRCIEAVNTAPYYRRSQLRRWRKLAEEQLRALQLPATGAYKPQEKINAQPKL